jgi:uncharacterized protein
MSKYLTGEELDFLARGSWILGTGGGGSPYSSYLSLRQHYKDGGKIELLNPHELADDDLVAVFSTMGAPWYFRSA